MMGYQSIFVGLNEFVGCTDVINIDGNSLFSFSSVRPEMLINLSIPAPALGIRLDARDNKPLTLAGEFRIEKISAGVKVFWKSTAVLKAEDRPDGVHVEFDFRPLGLDMWTDSGVLNLGASKLMNNRIEHAGTGIAIGA